MRLLWQLLSVFLMSAGPDSLGVRIPPQVVFVHCQLRFPVLRTPHVLLWRWREREREIRQTQELKCLLEQPAL